MLLAGDPSNDVNDAKIADRNDVIHYIEININR